jgi:hypothetical protein
MSTENNSASSLHHQPAIAMAMMDGDDATPVDVGGIANVLTAQRWIGRRTPVRPVPGVTEPTCRLLLCDTTFAERDVQRVPENTRLWLGTRILADDPLSPEGASALLCLMMSIDSRHEEEFNAWYDTEHIVRLRTVPGVITARRFRAFSGSPMYLAVYHLASLEVPKLPEWRTAAATPWTARMLTLRYAHERFLFTPDAAGSQH